MTTLLHPSNALAKSNAAGSICCFSCPTPNCAQTNLTLGKFVIIPTGHMCCNGRGVGMSSCSDVSILRRYMSRERFLGEK